MRGGWSAASLDALGDRTWAVLGGGGLKGLAHVGAWEAFEEAGVRVRGIVGTSIGALVGALLAGGMRWEEMAPLAFRLRRERIVRINRRVAWVNGIRAESVFLAEPLREYIEEVLPVASWEGLRIPLQINAVDLETGETVWFGPGARTDVPLAEAVYASAALPVLYPPARVDGRYLVDGGVGEALPLARAVECGASGLVAMDVGSGAEADAAKAVEEGLVAIHQRVFSIQSGYRRRQAVETWRGPPLLYVRPRLDGYGTFDFDHVKYFLEEGYRAARAALMGSEEDGGLALLGRRRVAGGG